METEKTDAMKKRRFVFNDDGSSLQSTCFRPGHAAQDMRTVAGWVLDTPVDTYVYCTACPLLCNHWSRVVPQAGVYRDGTEARTWRIKQEVHDRCGTDLLRIAAEACRERGKSCLAGFRMNDSHHSTHGNPMARFIYENRDKWIQPLPQGKLQLLDYAHPEVRDTIFAVMEETVRDYPVDGLDLDFLRGPDVFSPPVDDAKRRIMTDFLRRIRTMLDTLSGRDGRPRRCLLGVRVPGAMEYAIARGLDVAEWVKQDLIDYICPGTGFLLDFNADVSQWIELCRGSRCQLLWDLEGHTASPWLGRGHQFGQFFPVTDAEARAFAANAFHQGADGMYTFNIFVLPNVQRVNSILHAVADRESVYAGARHYLYLPADPHTGVTRRDNQDNIRYTAQSIGRTYPIRFCCADGERDVRSKGSLQWRIFGGSVADGFQFKLNGTELSADRISVAAVSDQWTRQNRGPKLPPHTLYEISLHDAPALVWDNRLEITPLTFDPAVEGERTLEALEVHVE